MSTPMDDSKAELNHEVEDCRPPEKDLCSLVAEYYFTVHFDLIQRQGRKEFEVTEVN
jgi:hypothetical protein